MTHSGGKPHAVGDRGQRFEVSFNDGTPERKILGWTSTASGVMSFLRGIKAHPVWCEPRIIDRDRKPAREISPRTIERMAREEEKDDDDPDTERSGQHPDYHDIGADGIPSW